MMAAAEARAPTWAQAQAMQKRLSSILKKIWDLSMSMVTDDEDFFSGLSEAEREAKHAKAEEELSLLKQEYAQLNSEVRDPDFSGMTEVDRAAEAERLRQEALEEARRLEAAGDPRFRELEGRARIVDFDPKQGGMYFNRLFSVDLATFDHDEESPLGPMRFTQTAFGEAQLCQAVNILSVKIACSDVGFPIQVYGTVIARDNMDDKCVYLFRRDRDHCQLIKSKDEPLILTGPKRGLALVDDNYVETDLKIKDHQGQDRELSKGILSINGVLHHSLEECVVEKRSVATRLSTVDVLYAVVIDAVEATLAVKVLHGKFHGRITAHTSSILKKLVLYDSEVAGGEGHGVIRLTRRVVSVYVKDMLVIDAKTSRGKSVRVEFAPRGNSGDERVVNVGATKMLAMVAWSIMDP